MFPLLPPYRRIPAIFEVNIENAESQSCEFGVNIKIWYKQLINGVSSKSWEKFSLVKNTAGDVDECSYEGKMALGQLLI